MPHKFIENQISENLYSQVDSEGCWQLIFKSIIDHKKDAKAIDKADGFVMTQGGQQRLKITIRGCSLKVEWKEGTSSGIPLFEVKNANLVEVAEYDVASKTDDEPAFKWWIRHALRKRKSIISKVKSVYLRTTHKFGLRLPHSVKEAYEIYK
eukprot:9613428-Ditylum_brightwellii.AAC.2